eukprot:8435458-Alexandrium_andersonii.AAC.1
MFVGPIAAALLVLTVLTGCLLWRGASSWRSALRRGALGRLARRELVTTQRAEEHGPPALPPALRD